MVRALESAAPLVLEFVGVVGVVGVVDVSVGISPGLDLVRFVLLSTALSQDALAAPFRCASCITVAHILPSIRFRRCSVCACLAAP